MFVVSSVVVMIFHFVVMIVMPMLVAVLMVILFVFVLRDTLDWPITALLFAMQRFNGVQSHEQRVVYRGAGERKNATHSKWQLIVVGKTCIGHAMT